MKRGRGQEEIPSCLHAQVNFNVICSIFILVKHDMFPVRPAKSRAFEKAEKVGEKVDQTIRLLTMLWPTTGIVESITISEKS